MGLQQVVDEQCPESGAGARGGLHQGDRPVIVDEQDVVVVVDVDVPLVAVSFTEDEVVECCLMPPQSFNRMLRTPSPR